MADILITKIGFDGIDSVARLHMVAFKGYTNTLIGMLYVRAFLKWFCENDDAIALRAADKTNRTVGYVVGASLGYQADLNKKILWSAVAGITMRPWLVFNPRFRWIVANKLRSFKANKQNQSSKTPTLPSPTISLVGIGVHPEARGQGVGQELLGVFESLAVQSGFKSMRLSVYQDNTAARVLYTKAGWKLCNPVNEELLYYYKIFESSFQVS